MSDERGMVVVVAVVDDDDDIEDDDATASSDNTIPNSFRIHSANVRSGASRLNRSR